MGDLWTAYSALLGGPSDAAESGVPWWLERHKVIYTNLFLFLFLTLIYGVWSNALQSLSALSYRDYNKH